MRAESQSGISGRSGGAPPRRSRHFLSESGWQWRGSAGTGADSTISWPGLAWCACHERVLRVSPPVTLDLLREASRLVEAGERVGLATIVATRGSTPQKVGARLLAQEGRRLAGTLG